MKKYVVLFVLTISLFCREFYYQSSANKIKKEYNKEKPHINTATYDDLVRIVNIKHKRASDIIEKQPFLNKRDLIERTIIGEGLASLLEEKYSF